MSITVESLEKRLLFAFDPSAREQELLEMVNRMRTNPAGELKRLTQSDDVNVNSAINFFHVNLNTLSQQWAGLSAVPALAWNRSLYDAAQGHANLMKTFSKTTLQTDPHQLPGEKDLAGRATDAGYTGYSTVGENVFGFAKTVFYAHAGFAIDWGNTASGIQNPPGHRNNIMSSKFRETGIAMVDSIRADTGPILVTQDFGNRFSVGNPYFLGVAYKDTNHDGVYTAGEGLAGATIKLKGTPGTFTTASMTAGGYQLQVPAGTYSVTASGAALGGTITLNNVTVGSSNVKKDFRADRAVFAALSNNVLTINGTTAADTISITESGSNLVVNRNGTAKNFPAASVGRLEIFTSDGNDVVDWSTISKPAYIDAGMGNDKVSAGTGNDTLTGGAGKDTMHGGDGDDRINGSGTSDQLYGDSGNDRVYGGDGNDTLNGGGGVDRLYGGAGDDMLLGGSSNDKLYGEFGNDSLFGQKQDDLMDGGDGTDQATREGLDTILNVETILP